MRTGEILAEAGRDEEEILVQEYDLDELDGQTAGVGAVPRQAPGVLRHHQRQVKEIYC